MRLMNPSSSSLYMCEFMFFGNIWSWAIIPSTDLLTIGAFKDRSRGLYGRYIYMNQMGLNCDPPPLFITV